MEAYPLLRKYMDFSLREMKNSMLQAWTSRVLAAADEGKPIVYSQFTIFCELFTALDIPTIPPEVWNGMMMSMEPAAGAKAIDAAEQAGIHPELCATFKILIGNLLQGEIPRPAAVINTSYPCDSGRATYEILEYLCDVPHHVIECPYFANNDEALSYWVDRYKGTIRFLEETFHRRLDYDRLREVVEESNKTIEVILDINEVFKRKPLPVLGPTNAGYLAFQTLLGTPVATDFLKGYLADLNRAVASNSKAIEVERVRLLYGYAPFYWNPKFNRWLAEEKKTVVPASIFNFLSVGPVDTSTNESMIMGLAERAVRMPMAKHGGSPSEFYINECLDYYDQFQCDCIVINMHAGCKWLHPSSALLKDVCKKRGIPVLYFLTDTYDSRVTPLEKVKQIYSEFLDGMMS